MGIYQRKKMRFVSGLFFLIGLLVCLGSLIDDPAGSAIRQQVIAQHQTNGLLMMIFAALIGGLDK
jgi:hypothetical protein